MSSEWIIESLARVSRKRSEDIQGHLSLQSIGLSRSFGLSALRSLLEKRLGFPLPPLDPQLKVVDLIAMIDGNQPMALPPVVEQRGKVHQNPDRFNSPITNLKHPHLGLGLDIQETGELPEADDYRSHHFYVGHFSPAEISTAMLRPDPRSHLCGLFCAKEALKKSHPDLLDLRMTEIQIEHDQAGRPSAKVLNPNVQGFSTIISISHTTRYSVATCLTFLEDV